MVDSGLAALALALLLAMMAAGGIGTPPPDLRDVDALGVALAAVSTLPVAFRRARPLLALALALAGSMTLSALHYGADLPMGAAIVLYGIGAGHGRPVAGRWVAVAVGGSLAAFAVVLVNADWPDDDVPLPELAATAAIFIGAWVAGDRVAQVRRDAQRERRLAAAEERARIARELHDSAGHAINVILVQAGAARLLRDRDPEAAGRALETVEEVARATITDIDRIVHVLREGEPDPPVGGGLPALERLAGRHRDVTLGVAGAPRPLPGEVDRALFRIVQEALTNAARHGAGGARVEVAFGDTAVEVHVSNPMSGSARPGTGHGLTGMRERVALLDGELATERANGAFHVRARLPLP